jgi:hypothetical protein
MRISKFFPVKGLVSAMRMGSGPAIISGIFLFGMKSMGLNLAAFN